MIQNQLSKRGAQNRYISDALKKLVDTAKVKTETIEKLGKGFVEEKMKREDVQAVVRMHQAIENENEPTWKEVKAMKDILQGASPNSPEAIELNLARATKTAGLSRSDLTQALIAQKVVASLGIDPKCLAKAMHIQKNHRRKRRSGRGNRPSFNRRRSTRRSSGQAHRNGFRVFG